MYVCPYWHNKSIATTLWDCLAAGKLSIFRILSVVSETIAIQILLSYTYILMAEYPFAKLFCSLCA